MLPSTMAPGEERRVAVSFRNSSGVSWPADGHLRPCAVHLSNRWIRGATAEIEANYGNHRVAMPVELLPGERITLEDRLVAPMNPGDYVVQFDLVQSEVAWFASRGANLKLVLVRIR